MTDEELFLLARSFTSEKLEAGAVPEESFVPSRPHPKQEIFLDIEHDPVLRDQKVIEALFGGATGGGKTWTMLAAILKYVHVANYSALILRRNFPDLTQEGGLIALAHEFLQGTPAKWSEKDKTWTFPSGATLRFGFLETENDKYRYQGGEYQAIAFDELTQFTESQYKYLFSRLRKRGNIQVPLRMLSATNPGGIGGKWVFERFIPEDFDPQQARSARAWYKPTGEQSIAAFVPSMLDDNPSLDRESYMQSLMQLDEITRQQYLNGDWQIQVRGDILYTYSEAHTVISWSQFSKVFGEHRIPRHWKTSVYQDFGTTEGHPCVTSWFATAGQNAPKAGGVSLANTVYLYRGLMVNQTSARTMAETIRKLMKHDRDQCGNWQMSHEASSERIEYNNQGLPFVNWKTGATRGIEQLKNALALSDTDRPHPFKPELAGHPQLFLVVDDAELVQAKTDRGLARWRAEILAYQWDSLKSGEPMTTLKPKKFFDDAVDTMRAAAFDYFPRSADKTAKEKVHEYVEQRQPIEFVDSIRDPVYRAHVMAQRAILAAEAQRKLEEVRTIVSDWVEIG